GNQVHGRLVAHALPPRLSAAASPGAPSPGALLPGALLPGALPPGAPGAGSPAGPRIASSSGPPRRRVSAASTAAATRYTRSSARTGAMICSPTGRPSSGASPHGTDRAALPARFDG